MSTPERPLDAPLCTESTVERIATLLHASCGDATDGMYRLTDQHVQQLHKQGIRSAMLGDDTQRVPSWLAAWLHLTTQRLRASSLHQPQLHHLAITLDRVHHVLPTAQSHAPPLRLLSPAAIVDALWLHPSSLLQQLLLSLQQHVHAAIPALSIPLAEIRIIASTRIYRTEKGLKQMRKLMLVRRTAGRHEPKARQSCVACLYKLSHGVCCRLLCRCRVAVTVSHRHLLSSSCVRHVMFSPLTVHP